MSALVFMLLVFFMLVMGAVFVFVAARPASAAYIFLATQPFVGGIDRGALIPILRPSEAVQLGVTAAVIAGAVYRAARGERLSIRFTRLDGVVIALAVLSSVWPLFWLLARGTVPSSTDLFSTVVMWRLASLYALFRWVIRTPEQARRCLWVLLIGASLLASLALVDSLGIYKPGGPWTPTSSDGSSTGRGGATLNSAIAVGDYLSYSLGVALVWLLRHRRPRVIVASMACVIVLGILGTGQFSAWIGAFLVVLVVARYEGQLGRLAAWMVPIGAIGAVIAGPVISQRLAGFRGASGLPPSWLGRYDNLVHFYLPRLSGFRWVLGVRPDSVLPAPETWRDIIYLESGYLWLFWVGGIPFFLGFLWFLRKGFQHTKHVATTRADDIGVAAVATRGALWCLAILSIIDPHLTLRGGGDLFFCLLGLSANLNVRPTGPGTATPQPRALFSPGVRQRALVAAGSNQRSGP